MSATLKGTRHLKSPHHHRLHELLNFGPEEGVSATTKLTQQRIQKITREIEELTARMDKLSGRL